MYWDSFSDVYVKIGIYDGGYRPVLMETFVDPGRYHGSPYKASNWKYLGYDDG